MWKCSRSLDSWAGQCSNEVASSQKQNEKDLEKGMKTVIKIAHKKQRGRSIEYELKWA
jgi:hypothetical protein